MADTSALRKYFKNYLSNLKDTSFDKSNGEHLCQSDKEVVNFDDFTQKTKDFDFKQSKSCDALILFEFLKEVYCIEFKNQKHSDIDSDDMKGKYVDSLNNITTIFQQENIKVKNYKFYFFVVFKNPNNFSAYKYRGMQNQIRFGLDNEKNKYKDIYTIYKSIIRTEPKDNFKDCYRKIFNDKIDCFDK